MLIQSFKYAFRGLISATRTGRNLKIMLVCFILVIAAGILLSITMLEWIALLVCSFVVISLELVNTSIETTVDLCTTDHHPLAKKAKDIAASAVLIASIASFIIACIIFIPRIINLL